MRSSASNAAAAGAARTFCPTPVCATTPTRAAAARRWMLSTSAAGRWLPASVSPTRAASVVVAAVPNSNRTPAGRSSSSLASTVAVGSVPVAVLTVTRSSPGTPLGNSSTVTSRTSGSASSPLRMADAVPLFDSLQGDLGPRP